jgi:hypothetical protein
MTGGPHKTWDNDDNLIPEPALIARQLGWTHGWTKAWTWSRLVDLAERRYWENRQTRRIEDAA